MYEHFRLSGEERIRCLVNGIGLRVNRMMDALERFIRFGDGLGTEVLRRSRTGVSEKAVFLTPARELLRAAPDAAALLVVDRVARTLRLAHVYEDYADGDQWRDVVSRARREIEE